MTQRMLMSGRFNSTPRTVGDGEADDVAIAVDGSIITSLSAIDNAVLDAIAASLVTLAAAVPGGQTIWSATDNNATAEGPTQLVAAPATGLSLYITDIIISNGAVAGNILFSEDTGTANTTVIEKLYFGINSGTSIHLKTPIKITAEKNFGYTSVSMTTHSITVNGYTAA